MLARALLIGFMLSFSQGCKGDRITGLNVQGDAEPTFVFSGGGWLTGFTVRNIGTEGRPAQGDDITWEIKPEKSMDGARHIADIGTIQYGVVPTGYRQVRPVDSLPPQLLEGHIYLTMAYTTGSTWGRVVFRIQSGKAVAEEVSDGN
jgi:hypothetical protein